MSLMTTAVRSSAQSEVHHPTSRGIAGRLATQFQSAIQGKDDTVSLRAMVVAQCLDRDFPRPGEEIVQAAADVASVKLCRVHQAMTVLRAGVPLLARTVVADVLPLTVAVRLVDLTREARIWLRPELQ